MGRSPNSALTPTGTQQVKSLAQHLADEKIANIRPDAIISSSLLRCKQTATLIATKLEIPLHLEDAFWELSKGQWEGTMPRIPLPEPWLSQLNQDPFHFRYPKGESHHDLQKRIAPAFQNWIKKFPTENLLFVLHGDVLLNLLQQLIEFPPRRINDFNLQLCSLTHFVQTPTNWILNFFNHSSFLPPQSR